VLQVVLNKGIVLQVPLNGVKLDHRIGDRRSCRKHCPTPSGQLVQVPAFHKEVAGLHCFGLSNAAYIPHFCKEKQVLVVVTFIDKESINTQLLKGHGIILFGLVVELIELLLDRFLCAFQLFYREVISTVLFQFRNALRYLIKLLFKDRPLPFNAHRDFFKLAVTDDDGIIIAGGDSTAKAPAVLCFKVFFRGN